MRLTFARVTPILVLSLFLLGTVHDAAARGLYVGHGRRSADDDWSVRLNLGGGFTTATDPWDDEIADSRTPVGGYATAGLEFNVGHRNSLEIHGTYRDVSDEESFLEFDRPGGEATAGFYDYELTSWSGGLTLRHRYPHGGGASYWGVGGGVVEAEAEYQERVGSEVLPRQVRKDTAPEAHALVGWDGRLSPGLTLGLEIGFRYTWLEYEDFEASGDLTGFFGGLRLGIELGGR